MFVEIAIEYVRNTQIQNSVTQGLLLSCAKNSTFSLSVGVLFSIIFVFSYFRYIEHNGALLYIGVPAGPYSSRNINSSCQLFHYKREKLKRQACVGKSVSLMVIWMLFKECVAVLRTYS